MENFVCIGPNGLPSYKKPDVSKEIPRCVISSSIRFMSVSSSPVSPEIRILQAIITPRTITKIITNKETIPGEKLSSFITSGLRIGTPAITSRGMNQEDCKIIANLIYLSCVDFENKHTYYTFYLGDWYESYYEMELDDVEVIPWDGD